MKKLLRKLFLYLFKEDFKRMKALERDLEGLIHRQKCATSLAEVLTLSRNKLSDKIVGGDLVVSDMLNGVVISIEHD